MILPELVLLGRGGRSEEAVVGEVQGLQVRSVEPACVMSKHDTGGFTMDSFMRMW